MDPECRVRELVKTYAPKKRFSPMTQSITKTSHHAAIFETCINQELKLIRSRSARLDKSEISIVQKAFMVLMDNPNHHMGGAELYVEEIIGLKLVAAEDKRWVLQTAVEARDLILNNSARDEKLASRSFDRHYFQVKEEERFLSPEIVAESHKGQDRPALLKAEDCHDRITLPPKPARLASVSNAEEGRGTLPPKAFGFDSDPNINRLWHLFEVAREDFLSCYTDNHHRTKAAKFLRDTAENAIDYIKLKEPSSIATNDASSKESHGLSQKFIELKSSLNQAVEVVNTAYGGKKRRFDYGNLDMPGGLKEGHPKRSSNGNIRQPQFTSRPVQPRLQRGPRAHYHGQRKNLLSERPPRSGSPNVTPCQSDTFFSRPRVTDTYWPAYH